MERYVTDFYDLPAELLDMILSLLDDDDFINVANVSRLFQDSVERLIVRGKKLCFSERYGVKDEPLVKFLTQFEIAKQKLSHIDLNYCCWLGPEVHKAVIQLENLCHLHVMDCRLSPSVISVILNLKLTSLSISWLCDWLRLVELSHDPQLFDHLKHLVINTTCKCCNADGYRALDSTSFAFIQTILFSHCNELESLKMWSISEEWRNVNNTDSDLEYEGCPFDEMPYEPLLPKLRSLHLYINCKYSDLVEFVFRIIKRKRNLLKDIYLGEASFTMLDADESVASRIVPCISVNEISAISWENYPNRIDDVIEEREMLIWRAGATPNCKAVCVCGVSIFKNNAFFESMTTNCPRLRTLQLKKCGIYAENLLFGLTAVASIYLQLTSLVLHVKFLDETPVSISFYKVIGEFKALTELQLTNEILMSGESFDNIDTRPLNALDSHDLKNEMKKCQLYQLTQDCANIKEFSLSTCEEFELPDVMLACCSVWSGLKNLHFESYTCLGDQDFLATILMSCKQLTTLKYKIPEPRAHSRYLMDSFTYAESLRDLRIFGWLHLSIEMCECLEHCVNLENFYVNVVCLPIQSTDCIEVLITKLTKLTYVEFEFSDPKNDKRIEKELGLVLEKFLKIRFPFFYSWKY